MNLQIILNFIEFESCARIHKNFTGRHLKVLDKTFHSPESISLAVIKSFTYFLRGFSVKHYSPLGELPAQADGVLLQAREIHCIDCHD